MVYHLAGISDIGDAMISPIKTSKINILGTLNILEGCVKFRVKDLFLRALYMF